MKYIILTVLCLTITACVQEGPPYDNLRNQRAQESLRDTDNQPPAGGYYDNRGVWHTGTAYYSGGYYDRDGYWHEATLVAPAAPPHEDGYYDANGVWHDSGENGADRVVRDDN